RGEILRHDGGGAALNGAVDARPRTTLPVQWGVGPPAGGRSRIGAGGARISGAGARRATHARGARGRCRGAGRCRRRGAGGAGHTTALADATDAALTRTAHVAARAAVVVVGGHARAQAIADR